MDSQELGEEIRNIIDEKTLAAELGEEEACEVAIEALEDCVIGYSMRLDEVRE